jgi:hypothetical protein
MHIELEPFGNTTKQCNVIVNKYDALFLFDQFIFYLPVSEKNQVKD